MISHVTDIEPLSSEQAQQILLFKERAEDLAESQRKYQNVPMSSYSRPMTARSVSGGRSIGDETSKKGLRGNMLASRPDLPDPPDRTDPAAQADRQDRPRVGDRVPAGPPQAPRSGVIQLAHIHLGVALRLLAKAERNPELRVLLVAQAVTEIMRALEELGRG